MVTSSKRTSRSAKSKPVSPETAASRIQKAFRGHMYYLDSNGNPEIDPLELNQIKKTDQVVKLGKTLYKRESLKKWLKVQRTDPMTRRVLTTNEVRAMFSRQPQLPPLPFKILTKKEVMAQLPRFTRQLQANYYMVRNMFNNSTNEDTSMRLSVAKEIFGSNIQKLTKSLAKQLKGRRVWAIYGDWFEMRDNSDRRANIVQIEIYRVRDYSMSFSREWENGVWNNFKSEANDNDPYVTFQTDSQNASAVTDKKDLMYVFISK